MGKCLVSYFMEYKQGLTLYLQSFTEYANIENIIIFVYTFENKPCTLNVQVLYIYQHNPCEEALAISL